MEYRVAAILGDPFFHIEIIILYEKYRNNSQEGLADPHKIDEELVFSEFSEFSVFSSFLFFVSLVFMTSE